MAARVFDTYMPGGEDPLIFFINSISNGRILCLAILVSAVVEYSGGLGGGGGEGGEKILFEYVIKYIAINKLHVHLYVYVS